MITHDWLVNVTETFYENIMFSKRMLLNLKVYIVENCLKCNIYNRVTNRYPFEVIRVLHPEVNSVFFEGIRKSWLYSWTCVTHGKFYFQSQISNQYIYLKIKGIRVTFEFFQYHCEISLKFYCSLTLRMHCN